MSFNQVTNMHYSRRGLIDLIHATTGKPDSASLEAGQSKPRYFVSSVGGAVIIDPAPDAGMEGVK